MGQLGHSLGQYQAAASHYAARCLHRTPLNQLAPRRLLMVDIHQVWRAVAHLVRLHLQ
jgi:hypothetical protein